jgi:hypothetical protein
MFGRLEVSTFADLGARQAHIPTPARSEASRALREAALDPCLQGVLGLELWHLLVLPRGLECLAVYAEVKRRLGRVAKEAHKYRDRLIREGEAPFRCRAGARYLYVHEWGLVRWCAQTRTAFGKPLLEYTLDDLRDQFYTGKSCHATCSVGCVRTASAYDEWRVQRPPRAGKT